MNTLILNPVVVILLTARLHEPNPAPVDVDWKVATTTGVSLNAFGNHDISYNDFVVAYVIPASDGKLSSDVLYQEFHKIPRSCFNYVFYDKGAYSDGWRYIEICPIEQEGIYGLKGTITTAVESGLGQGVENTNKIASSISSTNSVISESSAAQNALNFVYVNMDDWYLPSIDELKEAKKVYPELFSMFSDYWSSTEKDSEEAYTLRWSRDKDSELKYFVVRRF